MQNKIHYLIILNFIFETANSTFLPFLIFILLTLSENEVICGIIGATFYLFEFFSSPFIGKFADSFGKKKVLFLTQLGTIFNWLIFLIALQIGKINTSLALLLIFIARALDGLTTGQTFINLAFLAEISPPEKKDKIFNQFSASTHLGNLAGSLIGGIFFFIKKDEKILVELALFLSLLCLAFIHWKIPSTPQKSTQIENNTLKKWKEDSKNILQIKKMKFFLIFYFLIFFNLNIFNTVFPLQASKKLYWSTYHFSIFTVILSGITFIIQHFILTKILHFFSKTQFILIGLFFMSISLFFFSKSEIFPISLSMIFFGIGNGISWPPFLILFSRLSPPSHQSLTQGFGRSMNSLASILGWTVGSTLYSYYQNQALIFGSVGYFLAFLMFLLFSIKKTSFH